MDGSITWVGIDAHKKTLAVAALHAGRAQPEELTIENNEPALKKLVRRLEREAKGREIRLCYEAGPCGYALKRQLESGGAVACDVIAPSLIPRKPGERVKTDRRDARKLLELYRAGLLTPVAAPTPEQEAIRDLCRCREDVRADLGRCRHRLVKMLVRRGHIFNSSSRLWSKVHRSWLQALVFEDETDRSAQLPIYRDHVAWLRCFRGIDTTIAMIFVTELHGVERFESPRKLAAYLGLVPTVHSSGDATKRGPPTENDHAALRRPRRNPRIAV